MNIKKIIICVIILIILLIIGISIVIKYMERNSRKMEEEVGDPGIVIDYEKETTKEVTDFVKFYTVSNCVNAYLDRLNVNNSSYYGTDENNNYTIIFSNEEINGYICDLLSQNYIEENQISVDNLRDKIEILEEQVIFTPLEMNVLMQDIIEKYVVHGFLTDLENNFIKEIYVSVNLDISNHTFSIEPIENSKYENIDAIEIINDNQPIEKNSLNVVTDAKVNYEFLCKEHLNSYKKMILALPELAYEHLDDEYKQERFGSYEKFTEYITENYNNLFSLTLSEYQVNTYDGYREYVCVDTKGNYYLFKEASIMEYKVQLDTYTIKSETYIENYNTLKDPEKASVNVDIFIQMINTKDYHHAYEVLAEGFKNNYFPTEEDFKNYMKENFYDYNVLKINTSTNEGIVYIFKSTLTNGGNTETENQNKTFNVLLGEGTDFTISFNV